jgi:hypothetical protein
MMSDLHPDTWDPVRRLLSDCGTIAFCDPAGAAGKLRLLLQDHYRVLPVASMDDPAVSTADLLVVASHPALPAAPPAVWPPAVWLQPGVVIDGIPGQVVVHRDEDLRAAFTGRFLSSCSG